MENEILGNLIKITSSKREPTGDVLVQPVSLNFFQVSTVKTENLPSFIEDLESLSQLLDNVIIDCYRLEIGPDLQEKYETLLRELKLKDNKIKYLNGYFETITAKMQAVHRAIAEKEKKIKDATDRKRKIESHLSKLRGRYSSRGQIAMPNVRPIPILRRPFQSFWSRNPQQADGDIELHLEPIPELNLEVTEGPLSESEAFEANADLVRWEDDNEWDDDGVDDGIMEDEEE